MTTWNMFSLCRYTLVLIELYPFILFSFYPFSLFFFFPFFNKHFCSYVVLKVGAQYEDGCVCHCVALALLYVALHSKQYNVVTLQKHFWILTSTPPSINRAATAALAGVYIMAVVDKKLVCYSNTLHQQANYRYYISYPAIKSHNANQCYQTTSYQTASDIQ